MNRKLISLILIAVFAVLSIGCCSTSAQSPAEEEKNAGSAETPLPIQESASEQESVSTTEITNMEKTLHLFINEREVAVNWEDNESVNALADLVSSGPLTVQMSMYGGFEQVGSLGTTLPRNDSQTTTQSGDIVLYSGNQIVIFYGSNSWAYTRLGKVADQSPAEMKTLLGSGDVTVTLSWK